MVNIQEITDIREIETIMEKGRLIAAGYGYPYTIYKYKSKLYIIEHIIEHSPSLVAKMVDY